MSKSKEIYQNTNWEDEIFHEPSPEITIVDAFEKVNSDVESSFTEDHIETSKLLINNFETYYTGHPHVAKYTLMLNNTLQLRRIEINHVNAINQPQKTAK